jgi:hypothetical protein
MADGAHRLSATASADIQAKFGTPWTSTSAFCWNSVRVKPGQTQRTCTPVSRSSAAIASDEAQHERLRRRVRRHVRAGREAAERRDVHEHAAAACHHAGQTAARELDQRLHVQPDLLELALDGKLIEAPAVPKPALFTSQSTTSPRRSTSPTSAGTAPGRGEDRPDDACAERRALRAARARASPSRSARRATSARRRPVARDAARERFADCRSTHR